MPSSVTGMAHAVGDAFRGSVPPSVSDRTNISNARVARTALWVIAAAWVFASGCAQQDWIDRTLVTVDVTGVWEETQTGTNFSWGIELDLKQEGAKVTGWVTGIRNTGGTAESPIPIVGTVSGDTFSFPEVSGIPLRVQAQVNGDEMTGSRSWLSTWTIALHRRPQ